MFSILRRLWLRNTLYIMLAVAIFLAGLSLGAANATTGTPLVPRIVGVKDVREDLWVEARFGYATTTTTTTVAPHQVRRNMEPTVAPKIVAPQGDWVAQCHVWASQAGITLTADAIALIDKESDCSPTAQNPRSSACGIAQNIRGCTGTYGYDPVQQLIWMNSYVNGRYGGWSQAWQFWNCIGYCRGIYKTSTWY